MFNLAELNAKFEAKSATDILKWAYGEFDPARIKVSTSFGAEGVVLIHILLSLGIKPRVFTVDTGRNFQETYAVWNELTKRYGLEIEVFAPDPEDLRNLLTGKGPDLFYESVAQRKACCHVRKVLPLRRALADTDVWIASLRRSQGESRMALDIISRNEEYGLHKLCPMANWLEQNVWTYIRANDVVYSKLYDQGFQTIGCAPCTRQVRPSEGLRSGRWWWEEDETKECGMHVEDGKVVRKKTVKNFQI